VILYKIKNWESQFETSETKKLAVLKWVPTPNKHDGLGFRRVAAQKNRCELFSAWNLILQIASRGKRGVDRGLLQRQGIPLGPQEMSLMTGFPSEIFEVALKFFSGAEVGWLEVEVFADEQPPESPAEPPATPGNPPAEEKRIEGREWNGIEEKGAAPPDKPASPRKSKVADDVWLKQIAATDAYKKINVPIEFSKCVEWCKVHGRQPTRATFVNWLNRIHQPMDTSLAPIGNRRRPEQNQIQEDIKIKIENFE
jgi:hypothetical protein